MSQSLKSRILNLGNPFILYHTYQVDEKSIQRAISENKSMDLDIAIDANGKPFIGHSLEYYKISGEEIPQNTQFYEAVSLFSKAHIPLIVDCKQVEVWEELIETINQLGDFRCLVHIFAKELKFDYDLGYDKDYPSEWIPIANLKSLKKQFPAVTTTVSCKYLPPDLLSNSEHKSILENIRRLLNENEIDTVCLNIPDETITDEALEFFLSTNIIPHVNIDGVDISKLTKLYIGETNILDSASDCRLLDYLPQIANK